MAQAPLQPSGPGLRTIFNDSLARTRTLCRIKTGNALQSKACTRKSLHTTHSGPRLTRSFVPMPKLLWTFSQSRFAGFLHDTKVNWMDHKDDADLLTNEGVLLRSEPRYYHMSSRLVDEFIRTKLIPAAFPHASSTAPPIRDGSLCVLDALTESLKFFGKNLILACNLSYKSPKVKILSASNPVPRESVYETELMRVLTNWLYKQHDWAVTSQWRFKGQKIPQHYTPESKQTIHRSAGVSYRRSKLCHIVHCGDF
jgi:hypothetical protein